MNNTQKGSAAPIIAVIIGLIVGALGVYMYMNARIEKEKGAAMEQIENKINDAKEDAMKSVEDKMKEQEQQMQKQQQEAATQGKTASSSAN